MYDYITLHQQQHQLRTYSSKTMGFICIGGQPQHQHLTCTSTTKKIPKLANDTVKRIGRYADAFMRDTIPSGQLNLVYVSSCAVIFRGFDEYEKPVICKVFNGSPKNYNLGKVELQAYARLEEAGVTRGVPQLYKSFDNDETMILVLQDLVMDAYDFVNGEHDCHLVWMKGIRDLVGVINDMHSKGIIHGDIKLENMAYDFSKWYLFDFAFSKLDPTARLTGTIPHLPPRAVTVHPTKLTDGVRMEFDYFAFAISMLVMFDLEMYEKCSNCLNKKRRCKNGCCGHSYVILEIETLYNNCWGQDVPEVPMDKIGRYNSMLFIDFPLMAPIYKALCNIILSEMDIRRRFLLWDTKAGSFEYQGANRYWSTDSPKIDTPSVYWKFLTELCDHLTSI